MPREFWQGGCGGGSVGEVVDTLEGFDYPGPRGKICWERDSQVQAVVDGWPRCLASEEASRLGIRSDASFSDILRTYVEDVLQPAG